MVQSSTPFMLAFRSSVVSPLSSLPSTSTSSSTFPSSFSSLLLPRSFRLQQNSRRPPPSCHHGPWTPIVKDRSKAALMLGKLGQSFNSAGIASSVSVFLRDHHLALPHLSVRDVRSIDWRDLKRRGFKGVVFDKDNTLTAPYSNFLWPSLSNSLDDCKLVFQGNVAILSNSAGLYQYDPDGSKAESLEKSVGINVIRHGSKKPAGSADDIEKHFGYSASFLVMVGDRVLTDIVYGNRNGFLTILTEPLNSTEEPLAVKQVRKLETYLLDLWRRKGLKAKSHPLMLDENHCIKNQKM
ncbi:phosphatidylglycerophosphate phosphatase 1, chloroplastic/mitochondrial isoform X1 [Nymphaea colorata]|uniref:phosphatidylglycerophosphate phosphatase 1, chloroplastic/mitochondrial isoform X1 n=1 Tax=Nymphaea colorata TaxID=210225 RepID=UPI00129E45D2|nr:phosphatidylglycerophosphate phosphatase 1, chloroplastic/mitochondrial isoform X1 [Nymphaea colorata]